MPTCSSCPSHCPRRQVGLPDDHEEGLVCSSWNSVWPCKGHTAGCSGQVGKVRLHGLCLALAASDVRLSWRLPCCHLCCGLMLTWMVQVPKQGRAGSPMLVVGLGLPSRAALGQRQAASGSPRRQDLAGRNSRVDDLLHRN